MARMSWALQDKETLGIELLARARSEIWPVAARLLLFFLFVYSFQLPAKLLVKRQPVSVVLRRKKERDLGVGNAWVMEKGGKGRGKGRWAAEVGEGASKGRQGRAGMSPPPGSLCSLGRAHLPAACPVTPLQGYGRGSTPLDRALLEDRSAVLLLLPLSVQQEPGVLVLGHCRWGKALAGV